MEQKFNTSFIPKKSLQADVDESSKEKYARRHSSQGPGFYVTLLLLVVAIATSIGLFGYTTIIENTVQKKISSLKEKKNFFTEKNIDTLIAEERRINLAKELLASHVAVSELFTEIENSTLKKIQYTGMEYVVEKEKDPMFTLLGIANDYQDVALQTRQFRSSAYISSPIVNELGSEETGLVYFSIGNVADPRLISFTSAVQNAGTRKQNTAVEVEPQGNNTGTSSAATDAVPATGMPVESN